MKKILVYGLTGNLGGLENFIANTLINMDFDGMEVHALVYEKTIMYEELKNHGVIFHKIIRRGENPIENKKQVVDLFNSIKFDVLWFNCCTLTYIEPIVQAKKSGVNKIILHSHCTEISKGFLMSVFHGVNKIKIDNYVDEYMGCTIDAAKFLSPKKKHVDEDFTIINNAINLEKFSYSKNYRTEIRRELKVSDDAYLIGNIGHLNDNKNQTFLIDVFSEIFKLNKNAYLILIGTGEKKEELEKKAKEYNLEEKIIFLGRRQDTNKILSAIDAFVMPSKHEGLPISSIEAQASGLKCFLSDTISKDAKVTDLVTMIGLDDTKENWAEIIINNSINYERVDTYTILTEAGFNIIKNAELVKNILLKN